MKSRISRMSAAIVIGGGIFLSASLNTESATPALVQNVIHTIEERLGGWIALKADLTMHFLTGQDQQASCHGSLLYNRLDEKILLKCFNQASELVFAFITEDRDFQIYVPGQGTVYEGDIFDLENSNQVESHLNPFDLYRGLKLATIPLQQAKIRNSNGKTILLDVYGSKHSQPYLARRLFVTHEGDVLEETYYDFEEEPSLIIRRSEIKSAPVLDPVFKRQLFFPHRIEFEAFSDKGHRTHRETILLFEKIVFSPLIEAQEWSFLPEVPREMEQSSF